MALVVDSGHPPLRSVQFDGPEILPLLQIDSQNLRQDLLTYLLVITVIAVIVAVDVLSSATTQIHPKRIEADEAPLRSVIHSISGLHPIQSELQFQMRSPDTGYISDAVITVNTSSFTQTVSTEIELPLFEWVTVFHCRLLNFTDLTIGLSLTELFHLFEVRFVTFSPAFGHIRVSATFCFATILFVLKVAQITSGVFTKFQLISALLSFATIAFDDPLLVVHFFHPSVKWLQIDAVLKTFYGASLLFSGASAFDRLRVGIPAPFFDKLLRICPLLYFAAQCLNDFVLNPIVTETYGTAIQEITIFTPAVGAVLALYAALFVANLRFTYTRLEASAEYAFWTYVAYAGFVAAGVACQALARRARVGSARFTFPMAAVNLFALVVDRAHAVSPPDTVAYEPAGDLGVAVGAVR
jgi:hypothetical protein